MMLVSLFDNLGKGSSGAAIQCMNLMLGLHGDRRVGIKTPFVCSRCSHPPPSKREAFAADGYAKAPSVRELARRMP
ncbi:MAG: hypothetical protein ACLVJH_06820 [Faecalibacterium prausnitzii]